MGLRIHVPTHTYTYRRRRLLFSTSLSSLLTTQIMKLLVSSLVTLLPALGVYGEIVKLNEANFAEKTESADLALVKFFAPWCGHCQAMADDWAAASEKVGDNVIIADVDCTEERGLCSKNGVQGYPTLMSFKKGKLHEEFYDRDVPSIVSYAKRNGGAGGDAAADAEPAAASAFSGKSEEVPASYEDGTIWTVVGANFDEIVMDESKHVFIKIYAPWCGHCKNMQPAWEDLAAAYKGQEDIVIAEIDATANDLPAAYQVRGYPTLFWAGKGGKATPVKYQGGRQVDQWKNFINEKVAVRDE